MVRGHEIVTFWAGFSDALGSTFDLGRVKSKVGGPAYRRWTRLLLEQVLEDDLLGPFRLRPSLLDELVAGMWIVVRKVMRRRSYDALV